MTVAPATARLWGALRSGWDRIAIYLPIILMGLMALGTYWLARNTPNFGPGEAQRATQHVPDYFMRGFKVNSFDPAGRLKSEVIGTEARHYPDTDTLEIDQPHVRAFNERGELTLATAKLGVSNADGSQVQLIGDAVLTREPSRGPDGELRPRMQLRGEFLHLFMDTERVRSHKPVTMRRGEDEFSADSLEFDNLDRLLQLRGRVRGLLLPGNAQAPADNGGGGR